MRRLIVAVSVFALLLCLSACSAGEYQNLRLFCEAFSRFADDSALARITPEQFFIETGHHSAEGDSSAAGGGEKYSAYLGQSLYLTCGTLPNGRVHTVTLTGLPEMPQREFYATALCLLRAYTGAAADQAERWLGDLHAGAEEVLGIQSFEAAGYRLSYAANAAGRYFRVSRLQLLPPEPALATLRETITNAE